MTAPAGTTKQKLRKRTRLSQPLAVVIAAVIAAVIGLAGAVINILGPLGPATTGPTQTPTSAPANSAVATAGPPSASVVTVLMAEEAAAAVAHRPADAIRLYVSTGFVRDDACGKPSQSHTWSGRDQILQWYQQLGRFSWLTHLSPEVSFTPDNAQATSATATAQTAGFTEPSATSPAGQEIHGNERWTFIRMNGKWLISSYTYNICLTGPEILKLRRAAK